MTLALSQIAPQYNAREHTLAAERMVQDMEKNTHTPGHWIWSKDFNTGDGRETWSLVGSYGYGILSCDGVPNSPQGLGDESNARLIASAPDLLAALEANLRDVRTVALNIQSGTASPESMIEWLQRMEKDIRAAIAKARGK